MRSIIGSKLASLHKLTKQNTMCWLLYTNLQNKTHYRRVALLQDRKKSAQVYRFKNLSGLETFPNNQQAGVGKGVGSWNKNVLGGKKLKN